MPKQLSISVNGQTIIVDEGVTIASALMNHKVEAFRQSIMGKSRMPLCGMGICFECRVTVNQTRHQRACMIMCEDRMEIVTDG